jgi:response regulator RpfG family c-di-GMP phosphodiesterase
MAPTARWNIMVIGFDANFCYLMQRYGRISAHELMIAKHDEDILVQVQQNQPGVIFLEVAHPGSFAWDLFKELKSHTDTCNIPIILCSWQGVELPDRQACPDLHLRLPILYEHFTAALNSVKGPL